MTKLQRTSLALVNALGYIVKKTHGFFGKWDTLIPLVGFAHTRGLFPRRHGAGC